MSNINSNKLSLYLILGIPVIGILLTTAYYYYVVNANMDVETRNQGVLIQPPKNIVEAGLSMQQGGQDFQWTAAGSGQWTFMVAGSGACDDTCREKLYLTRQIRLALGKYQPRIERLYLNLGPELDQDTAQWFAEEHPGLQVVDADGDRARQWFLEQPPALELTDARFYLVDPAGWVMMYYTEKQDYKDVIRDVKFLLKNS